MRIRCDSKILLRATLGVLAITALAAFVAPAPAANTVLFQDTFSYPTPGTTPAPPDPGYVTDINAQIDYSLRQSGSLVASGGPITYTQANHADQGGGMNLGYSGAVNGSSEVIQSAIGACFTPNMNFNNEKSAGGLIISYDAANWDPWSGGGASIAIASIGLNAAPTDADPRNLCQWTVPHFSFEFGYGTWFGGSAYGLWNSGSAISGGALNTPVQDSYLHHVELVCTDTSGHDNNPFDGVGNTHIEISVDYVPVGSYTKGSGGYANNYITLGGYEYLNNVQEWDNLTITQTEVPISPLNQWAGAAVGNWSDGSKWSSGIAAGGQGDVARFMAKNNADTTVNVTAPVTVGTIQFDSTHAYDIQSSNPSVNTITLDNLSGTTNAALLVDGGSHVISAPLVQAGALDIRLSLDTSLTLAGSVTGNENDWNIYGPGTFNLTGAASSLNSVNIPYTGSSSDILNVSGGSLSAVNLNVGERAHVTISGGGSVITSYSTQVNHLLTVTGAGSSLNTSIFSVFRPALYDDAPKVEVVSGGTLTASSIDIDFSGVGGSWIVLSAGGTIDTPWVGGDGAFNFNGGTLINSAGGGAKTSFDILALVFTNGGSYSLDPSEILIVSELLGKHDAAENPSEGTFTFNGGTLKCRPDPRGIPNYLGAAGQMLTHVYVNAPSTIDLNGQELDVYSPLEGASANSLTFTPGHLVLAVDSPDWHGPVNLTSIAGVGNCRADVLTPQALGSSEVTVDAASELWFAINSNQTVSNKITLKGPGNAADPNGAALAQRSSVAGVNLTLSGVITLYDDSGNGPDVGAMKDTTLTLSGKLTGSGGLKFRSTADYTANSKYVLSGSDSNNYSGNTKIEAGKVYLEKDSGMTAIASGHIAIGADVPTATAELHLGGDGLCGDNQINTAAVITMNSDATNGYLAVVDMEGHNQTIGGLVLNGGSNVIQNSGSADSQLTVADSIAGTGSLYVGSGVKLTVPSISIDSLIIGSTPATAAAVPEPNALVLLLVAGAAVAWFKRRDR